MINTTDDLLRLAELAGVPCVPYVLSVVEDYAHLRRLAAHLGTHLVIQMPYGFGGETTFFISDERYCPGSTNISIKTDDLGWGLYGC
jgi:biotin carboxylase